MARFDNLTGLPNRLSLHEDLARALAHAIDTKSRCAMLMIDLDRFKAVNDTSAIRPATSCSRRFRRGSRG